MDVLGLPVDEGHQEDVIGVEPHILIQVEDDNEHGPECLGTYEDAKASAVKKKTSRGKPHFLGQSV